MTIQLRPEIEAKLAQEARDIGQSLDELFASIAGEWLRRRELQRREDEDDVREALEVLRSSKPEERVSWEQLKRELNLP